MSPIARSLVALIAGAAIFAGLPLLAWGLADIPGFMANPARLAYVVLVALLQLFVLVRFPGAGRTGGAGKKLVRRRQVAVLLMQVLSLAVVLAAPLSDRAGIALVFASGPALGLAAALALVLLWRIQDEEALMHREFGAAWESYARRSWRLIPFLY